MPSKGPSTSCSRCSCAEDLEPRDVDVSAIVLAFVEHLAEREELDLEACGEFLVLVSALLELKARGLFPDEAAELGELEPEEAAEELARRLAEYRRMKEAAVWLLERLGAERERWFRVGPAPLAPQPERRLAAQDPERSATRCGGSPSRRRPCRSRTWRSGSHPCRSSSSGSARCSRGAGSSTSTRGGGALARGAGGGAARAPRAAASGRDRPEPGRPFAAIRVSRADDERTSAWTARSA